MIRADGSGADRKAGLVRSAAPWLLTAAAVWLGWQVVLQPLADRAPPSVAIRLAPTSPSVLRRAAEEEFLAGRKDNARALAAEALARTPFEVRALRVLGLVEADRRPDAADQILTLAGNWSLRDDPTHAWLIQQRLRQGDYGSALAHADTLVRRRRDINAQVFDLFTTSAVHDTRALRALSDLVAKRPPWRQAYIDSLYHSEAGYQVAVNLALALQDTSGPFSAAELYQLYINLMDSGRSPALPLVRSRLTPRSLETAVTDGDFSGRDTGPLPFNWAFPPAAGLVVEVLPVTDSNQALRVEYTGSSGPVVAQQLLMLAPGDYRFSARFWTESHSDAPTPRWTITCANGSLAGATALGERPTPNEPFTYAASVTIPREGCPVQWLRLGPAPTLDAVTLAGWFDDVSVAPTGTSGPQR